MGYFAETMALFEFKGDAEAAYANRRALEGLSGDHIKGKRYSDAGKAYVNSNSHGKGIGNGNDIIKSSRFSGSTAKEKMDDFSRKRLDRADTIHGTYDSMRKFSKGNSDSARRADNEIKQIRRSCKESFEEAFDSVIL